MLTYRETGFGAYLHRTRRDGDVEYRQPAVADGGRALEVVYVFSADESAAAEDLIDLPWDDDHRAEVIDRETGDVVQAEADTAVERER
jgi:hypothetical protein